jgi:DNA-binding transcriptional LysR family regulator
MGAPLFRRTGRGVVLTDLGERAVVRLRRWLQDTEQLKDDLRTDATRLMGEVRLGIIPSAAHPLITRLFEHLRSDHPGIRLDIAEAQGADLDTMLDSGSVDMAILFRFQRPTGRDERLLCLAHTFLVSAPGDPLTVEPTVKFAKLSGLHLVLPRRPSHWRNALDETARSLGFRLDALAEADSLTVQKELVAKSPGIYSILGPFSIEAELRSGRLQASRLVAPDLVRHVTLAFPRKGKLSPPARRVAELVQELTQAWGGQLTEPAQVEPTVHEPAPSEVGASKGKGTRSKRK